MQYRAEIDGLRALAILPVVFFHAGFSFVSGGFLGVDVFFVLSGYLITSIIIAELKDGSFTIVNFYERRARRILPALACSVTVSLLFAAVIFRPPDLKFFSQSLTSVALFSSNIYFFLKTDYFGPAAEKHPLLHTWSLAVEEQFYIIFPILLMILWRYGLKIVTSILVTAIVVSLVFSNWSSESMPTANFF